jgi:hypothetical protein
MIAASSRQGRPRRAADLPAAQHVNRRIYQWIPSGLVPIARLGAEHGCRRDIGNIRHDAVGA